MISIEIIKKEIEKFKILPQLYKKIKVTEMIPVYINKTLDYCNIGVFPALISNCYISQALDSNKWDLSYEDGYPGFSYINDNYIYLRTNTDNIEPLILLRDFQGIYKEQLEICEEFRLYHNLHTDDGKSYYKIELDGSSSLVVKIELTENEQIVSIRLFELKQFLAAKNMILSIQFDGKIYSPFSLEHLALDEINDTIVNSTENYLCRLEDTGNLLGPEYQSCLYLSGKIFISSFEKNKCGIWPYDEKKKYEDYIIGIDDNGNEIIVNSNPNDLGNFFQSNNDNPSYLTPVFFNKEVLDKYYKHSTTYNVEAGFVRCGGLWGLPIDNDIPNNKIVVWLGDLGRNLPYSEQKYWRGFNIVPAGGISRTFFNQQIIAKWCASEQPDLVFKSKYYKLYDKSFKTLGWYFYLPLLHGDEHCFSDIKIPTSDENSEFDFLILCLTKCLIDSLNEKDMKKKLLPQDSDKPGIEKLICFLEGNKIVIEQENISFLKNLQALRSSLSAHRKGERFFKLRKKLGYDKLGNRDVFIDLLNKANLYLDWINEIIKGISV